MLNHSFYYSVDMIRLLVMVEIKIMELFVEQYLYDVMCDNPCVTYSCGKKLKDFQETFNVQETYTINTPLGTENGENRFWLGFKHNTEKFNREKASLVIEFNPNKCAENVGLLYTVLNRFYSNPRAIAVKSCDICRDFDGIDIDTVTYEKNRKNQEIIFNTQKGRTRYLGKRGGHGTVKVYDKAAELKQVGQVRTRWEATLRFKNLYVQDFLNNKIKVDDINANLPTVHFGDKGFADCNNMMLKCAINAIKSDSAKLADFSPYMQKQIKPYLERSALFTISNKDMPEIIQSLQVYLKDCLMKVQQRKTG